MNEEIKNLEYYPTKKVATKAFVNILMSLLGLIVFIFGLIVSIRDGNYLFSFIFGCIILFCLSLLFYSFLIRNYKIKINQNILEEWVYGRLKRSVDLTNARSVKFRNKQMPFSYAWYAFNDINPSDAIIQRYQGLEIEMNTGENILCPFFDMGDKFLEKTNNIIPNANLKISSQEKTLAGFNFILFIYPIIIAIVLVIIGAIYFNFYK